MRSIAEIDRDMDGMKDACVRRNHGCTYPQCKCPTRATEDAAQRFEFDKKKPKPDGFAAYTVMQLHAAYAAGRESAVRSQDDALLRQVREALEMMLEFPKTGPATSAARAALAALDSRLEQTKTTGERNG